MAKLISICFILFVMMLSSCSVEKIEEPDFSVNEISKACAIIAKDLDLPYEITNGNKYKGKPEFSCQLNYKDGKGSAMYSGREVIAMSWYPLLKTNIANRPAFAKCSEKLNCYDKSLNISQSLSCWSKCEKETNYKLFGSH